MITRLWEAIEPMVCGAIIGAVIMLIEASGRWLAMVLQ